MWSKNKVNTIKMYRIWYCQVVDDILVQKRRDKKAAKPFFKKLLKGQQVKPLKIVTDKWDGSNLNIMHNDSWLAMVSLIICFGWEDIWWKQKTTEHYGIEHLLNGIGLAVSRIWCRPETVTFLHLDLISWQHHNA